jgi:hypothetical protein
MTLHPRLDQTLYLAIFRHGGKLPKPPPSPTPV